MQRLVALEEDHRRKVHVKEQEMGKIKEDLERKWDQERRQVNIEACNEEWRKKISQRSEKSMMISGQGNNK